MVYACVCVCVWVGVQCNSCGKRTGRRIQGRKENEWTNETEARTRPIRTLRFARRGQGGVWWTLCSDHDCHSDEERERER